ncbi:MAG: hypothetical protein LBE74_00775 [Treponema sp.]|nr:hypothetical protein [Treponema sp.]
MGAVTARPIVSRRRTDAKESCGSSLVRDKKLSRKRTRARFLLDAGSCTLVVTGQKNGNTVAKSDPADVTIPSNRDAVTTSVTVYPVLNGADELFSYRIQASGAVTDVSASWRPLTRETRNKAKPFCP